MGRLVGVDLARALAVFGMYIVHIAPSTTANGVGAWMRTLAEEMSSLAVENQALADELQARRGVA